MVDSNHLVTRHEKSIRSTPNKYLESRMKIISSCILSAFKQTKKIQCYR